MAEEKSTDVAGTVGTIIRPASILTRDTSQGMFPFEAFTFDPADAAAPVLTLNSPWTQAGTFSGTGTALLTSITGTAAALASSNPILLLGQIGYETDTLSFKIGDGATAYNSLTYFYRGLPVVGEPSLGTPHFRSKTSSAAILTQATTKGTWYTITLSGLPSGTKAAVVGGQVLAGAGAFIVWRPYNNGDTTANSLARFLFGMGQSGEAGGQGLVVVDSSGRFDVGQDGAAANATLNMYDWSIYYE